MTISFCSTRKKACNKIKIPRTPFASTDLAETIFNKA